MVRLAKLLYPYNLANRKKFCVQLNLDRLVTKNPLLGAPYGKQPEDRRDPYLVFATRKCNHISDLGYSSIMKMKETPDLCLRCFKWILYNRQHGNHEVFHAVS